MQLMRRDGKAARGGGDITAGRRELQTLVLAGVTKRFGGVTAVSDVSFTLEAGGSLGVSGTASGAQS